MKSLNIKSYNIRYHFNTQQGKIDEILTIFATNKEEVEIILSNLYPRIIKGSDQWKIDGVFVKSKEFVNENNNVKYITNR